MSSGKHGTRNERGETLKLTREQKSDEEKQMIKLLSLVSDKMNERFKNLKACFRYLDTNHSQSISINEFAQAIEHMRLKISFEDVKRLFNYLDKNRNGAIGYKEFTFLLEERWRGIDPAEHLKAKVTSVNNPVQMSSRQTLSVVKDCQNDEEAFLAMEKMARNKLKVPLINLKDPNQIQKINRQDADNYLTLSYKMPSKGRLTTIDNHMADIMKHDYLKKSIENRV